MPLLEAWEKVYINESFLKTVHGQLGCDSCHSGVGVSFDKDEAHQGLIAYPSEDAELYCEPCHSEEMATHKNSLHKTQEGFYQRFKLRAGYDLRSEGYEHMLGAFKASCGTCHTSCGECHVSRPRTVGGGFNWRHEFSKTPDLNTNCTACHGSRVGDEYKGVQFGLKADVHHSPHEKNCEFCHSAYEMHGGDGTLLS